MRLTRLEVENFRSIKDATGNQAIEFGGLSSSIGKNNAGKTNILSAIRFLLGKEKKDLDEELYWNKETDNHVSVWGFFSVDDSDLKRIAKSETRDEIADLLLNQEGFENTIGVCRRTTGEGIGDTEWCLIQFLPKDGKYQESTFLDYQQEQWNNKNDPDQPNFTKTNYRNELQREYPNINDFVNPKKKKNLRAWKEAYYDYVNTHPDDIDFSLQATTFPGDTENPIRETLLPELISIPAIKDADEATQRSGELGELVDELSGEIQQEVDKQIQSKLSDLYDQFDPESGKRHKDIANLERRITGYMEETFEDHSVRLEFPPLESKQLFRGATLEIDEAHLDSLSTENVGEGVKRTLIFSLLRTVADVRAGSNADPESGIDDHYQPPLLILYEEAELFLHPNLQKQLLQTFDDLKTTGEQVVFNTHSPLLIQHPTIDSINIVRKSKIDGTKVTKFDTEITKYDEKEIARLTEVQNVASYIFSDKVVLVEGISDKIILKKFAKYIDTDWDFVQKDIPILTVQGKGNFILFADLLNKIGINPYIVTDIDTVDDILSEICTVSDDAENCREAFIDVANQIKQSGDFEYRFNRDRVDSHVLNRQWETVLQDLDDLFEVLSEDEEPADRHLDALAQLKNIRSDATIRKIIKSDHDDIAEKRRELVKQLLADDILLLSGDIEDYYPGNNSGDKVRNATDFEPHEVTDLKSYWEPLHDSEQTDVEEFLANIFPA